MSKGLALLITFIMSTSQLSFREEQIKHARVKAAYDEKGLAVRNYFVEKNIDYTSYSLFLRIFKKEMKLEAWAKQRAKNSYVLLHTYDYCASSGTLGPKRKEGDLQIPEGIYYINHFNPLSNFHLSLGINYPNSSDKILSDRKHPGGYIYIHGNCVTVGCVPMTDDKIKELYILAIEARNGGQETIPVYIFPTKLDTASMNDLAQEFKSTPATISFWKNLQPIYQDFENTHIIKAVHVNSNGQYNL
jgi:murein L,D-transpeptidase YafK